MNHIFERINFFTSIIVDETKYIKDYTKYQGDYPNSPLYYVHLFNTYFLSLVEQEVAHKPKYCRMDANAIVSRAPGHRDLEHRAQLGSNGTYNATNNAVDELISHRRAENKEENRKKQGVHDFLRQAEHLLLMQKKSFGYALLTLSIREYFQRLFLQS